ALATWAGIEGKGSLILHWSYLSMGLRAAGTFLPLSIAILRPGLLSPLAAFLSSLLGALATIFWPVTGLPGEPLFGGLFFASLCTALGIIIGKRRAR
ncbi:MAG: sodium:solute symporter family protein, partial [Synergistales bacterium]|nr:sodium:solute symporter family protein [Synergistales bacterium]